MRGRRLLQAAAAAAALPKFAIAQGKPEKLVFVGDNGPWHWCLVEEVAPAFEKQHGIKVDFTLLPIDALSARLKAELNSGSSGIDIIQWTAPYAGWLAQHMEDHEKLLASTAGKHPDFDWDDFLPSIRDMASYQGKLLGIPYRVTASVLNYQKQLLADVGFAKAPENWAEFQSALIATTKAGAPNRYGLGIWGRQGPAIVGGFTPFLRGNGGRYFEPKTYDIEINNAKAVEALQYYGDLMTKYKVIVPDAITWEFDEIVAGGQNDRYAMTITLAPYGTLINDPKLSKTAGKWAWAVAPGAHSRDESRVSVGGWTFGVPTACKHKDWGFDGAIDCDIHPGVPNIEALLPYMDEFWRESFVARGIDGFDMMSYPLGAPITCRPDWRVKGERPGSSLPNMRRDALDAFGIGMAICNPLTGGQVAASETMGAAICSAVNDWIVEHWLNKEPRLRASIVVPAQAPLLAAEEIERRAGDKRFVQILMPAACETMLGRSYYWPIYEVATKYDLPIGLHAGSMYRYAPTSGGWPSHYLHDYVANSQLFEDQLLSLISNGVFNRYPSLRFVLIESGVTWLPGFIWRAIKTWRGVRAEVPWVKRSPAETIRENIRLTVQPIDAPRDTAVLDRIIEQIDSDRMLLFASDYPHWQFDGDAVLPNGLSPALLQRIRVDNPLETYPRLKETVQ